MADPMVICTIGYQGRTPQQFVEALVEASVSTVVDVRSKPLSRKAGFSKKALSAYLAGYGISYIHVPELGMPLDLLALRNTKDNTPILNAYRDRMGDCQEGLERIVDHASDRLLCLMCYEADPCQCHRGVIADHLVSKRQLEIRHL